MMISVSYDTLVAKDQIMSITKEKEKKVFGDGREEMVLYIKYSMKDKNHGSYFRYFNTEEGMDREFQLIKDKLTSGV